MYKMILVDDKKDVTEGIEKMGHWDVIGFEVIGKAFHGKEAFQLVTELRPNVVITDIRMPVMDGIELTKKIKETFPEIRIIILSGYDDFDYARQAVKLGADEYLLKPARINELKEAVLRAKVKLDQQEKSKKEQILLFQKLQRSLPLLKDDYFHYLVSSTDLDEEHKIEERFKFLDIQLTTKAFLLLIVEIDDYKKLSKDCGVMDTELMKFSIINITQELSSEIFQCEVFRHEQNKIVVLANLDKRLNHFENKEKMHQLANKINHFVKEYLKITVSIAISEVCSNIHEIYYVFREVNEALMHKLYRGADCIIDVQDIKFNDQSTFRYPIHIENELIATVKVGAVDHIEELLENYFNIVLENNKMSPNFSRKVLREFMVIIFRSTIDLDDCMAEEIRNIDYLIEFDELKTMKEMKQWIKEMLYKIVKVIGNERKSQLEKDVEKAKSYIINHYNESISLQIVADYVCISSSYFSSVFKEHVGEGFVDFLTRYRMEKAKELLQNKQYKIYEVASRVGYSDRRYFSELFKKHTGLNPAEYIENMKR